MTENCLTCAGRTEKPGTALCPQRCYDSTTWPNWRPKDPIMAALRVSKSSTVPDTMISPADPKPALPGQTFPEDTASREAMPICEGLFDYFPNALAYVAFISHHGSLKHNPGQPMHWARDKSTDHANKIGRHLIQRGQIDSDGLRHSGNLAWRALALLQTELEQAGLCAQSRASK